MNAISLVLAPAIAAAGCVEVSNHDAPWVEATAITGTLAPQIGPPPTTVATPGCRLRVATWNVHFGGDPDNLARQIAASHELASADVILTQEMEAYPSESGTRAERMAAALGMTWIYAPSHLKDTGTHGLAIFSRYPLETPRVRQLPFIDRPIDANPLIALGVDVVLGDDRVHVVDVHLQTRLSPGQRILQMHPVINDDGERLLVGGDLNTQPWSWVGGLIPLTATEAELDQDQATLLDAYLAQNRFAGAIGPEIETMRIPVFSMRLDQLYARDLPIINGAVEHVDGSDHWPVWFDVDRCP